MPVNYVSDFVKARLTFLHQTVYDEKTARFVPLTPYSSDVLAFIAATNPNASSAAAAAASGGGGGGMGSNKENTPPSSQASSGGGGAKSTTSASSANAKKMKSTSASGQYHTAADGAFVFRRAKPSPSSLAAAASAAAPLVGTGANAASAVVVEPDPIPFVMSDPDDQLNAISGALLTDLKFLGPPIPDST